MKNVRINKKEKQAQDRKRIAGKKWEEDDLFILATYEKYKQHKISADRLMEIFPGRSFHAIFSKVYNIRGKNKVVHKKFVDPKQLSFPFGGLIK